MIYKEKKSHERHVISMLYADYLSDRQYHRDAAISNITMIIIIIIIMVFLLLLL